MKKYLLLFTLLANLVVTGFAQSDRFTAAMQKNLVLMDSAKTAAGLQAVAASFERIGDAEKTQWLPYYYAGLALTRVGWMDKTADKDQLAGRIKTLADKAEAIEKNAEIYALRNMAATQQMLVDPQSRWQTYGMEAAKYLQLGLQINPNNPRLYYLQAMSIFNTPEQFGGGKAKARPVFEKAVALFHTEKTAPLYPGWGKELAEQMLAACNE